MARKRKHRVVVEITLDEPVTEKKAAQTVGMLLDSTLSDWAGFVTAWRAKEFTRVVTAMRREDAISASCARVPFPPADNEEIGT